MKHYKPIPKNEVFTYLQKNKPVIAAVLSNDYVQRPSLRRLLEVTVEEINAILYKESDVVFFVKKD